MHQCKRLTSRKMIKKTKEGSSVSQTDVFCRLSSWSVVLWRNVWNNTARCSQSATILNHSDSLPTSSRSSSALFSPLDAAAEQAVLSRDYRSVFSTNRDAELEECGAGFGQKIPTRQEWVWWVWRFIVCPTLYGNSCLATRVSLKCEFVAALRRGVGADGVEQHADDGGQRPEATLREEGADRGQDERAAPSQLSPHACMYAFYSLYSLLFYSF